MGQAAEPLSVKLFAGITFATDVKYGEILEQLISMYGPVQSSYGPVVFDFTDYYAAEMGEKLQKTYCVFDTPNEPGVLASVKRRTNDIEHSYSTDGRRSVNIDPGYLSRDKLVLASTKDFYHRVYLGQGIYAEVTLHYRQGRYRYFSWTYPDYKEPDFLVFLQQARAKLVGELRKGRSCEGQP